MKVGLVSPYDYTHPGGVSEHIRHLGDWLRQLGHEVRTFAPSGRRDAERDIPDFYRIGRVFSLPANDSVARCSNPLRQEPPHDQHPARHHGQHDRSSHLETSGGKAAL